MIHTQEKDRRSTTSNPVTLLNLAEQLLEECFQEYRGHCNIERSNITVQERTNSSSEVDQPKKLYVTSHLFCG